MRSGEVWEISFREMQVVEGVARLNSFSDAALELGITQSAISHTVSSLEERLKLKLFIRLNNSVQPTKFALPILKQFNLISETLSETQRELTASSTEEPGLKIQCGFRSNILWLTSALTTIIKTGKNVSFDIRVDLKDCRKNLASGIIDLVLSSLELFPNENEFSKILLGSYRNDFISYFGHSLTNRPNLSVNDLKNFPLIGDPVVVGLHNEFFKSDGKWGHYEGKENIFYPAIRMRNLKDIIKIISETESIGLLPKELIIDELKNNMLSILKFKDHTEKANHIYALYNHSRHSNNSLCALLNELRREVLISQTKSIQNLTSVDHIQ